MNRHMRAETLRKLGRGWDYPEERPFIDDYLNDRIPTCQQCGILMPEECHWQVRATTCGRCEDMNLLDEKNRAHDLVLVEEEHGYAYWAWYPDPPGMGDHGLEQLWKNVDRFSLSTDFWEMLGGEWYPMTPEGFHAHVDAMRADDELRLAHIHEDWDSFLVLPSEPCPEYGPQARRPVSPHTVHHRGRHA